MDNGLLACADLPTVQRLSEGLSPAKIDAFFRKWLARLPHPYSAQDRRAGYRDDLSVLQAEFSLTRSGTAAFTGAASSRKSFARTLIWAVLNRCS